MSVLIYYVQQRLGKKNEIESTVRKKMKYRKIERLEKRKKRITEYSEKEK